MMTDLKERAAFTLSGSVKAALEESIPKSKRSQFVESAIANALLNDAKQKALDAIDKAHAHETGNQSSVEVLRQIRSERTRDLVGRHQSTKP